MVFINFVFFFMVKMIKVLLINFVNMMNIKRLIKIFWYIVWLLLWDVDVLVVFFIGGDWMVLFGKIEILKLFILGKIMVEFFICG